MGRAAEAAATRETRPSIFLKMLDVDELGVEGFCVWGLCFIPQVKGVVPKCGDFAGTGVKRR